MKLTIEEEQTDGQTGRGTASSFHPVKYMYSSESIYTVCLSYLIWINTVYSKTCLKRPLKNRQNKDLNDKW